MELCSFFLGASNVPGSVQGQDIAVISWALAQSVSPVNCQLGSLEKQGVVDLDHVHPLVKVTL